jgi:DNA ligase-1
MSEFKPMLAAKVDLNRLRYPVWGSPKFDGIRATVVKGRLLTRTLKEVPNRYIFNSLSNPEYEGLDGELIVGDPTDKACYRNTVSGVMSHDGTPNFQFYVFDWVSGDVYTDRLGWAERVIDCSSNDKLVLVEQEDLKTVEDLLNYEQNMLELGHEGICLRSKFGLYKFGRSTTSQGWLLKMKRFTDSEAVIVGMEEEERNDNELSTDERGYAHRTSHKDNKVGKGRMGALVVRDVTTGLTSKIGTGFSAAEREDFWNNVPKYVGQTVKYRYFAIGVKDLPRHSSYLGLRPEGA